MTFLALVLLLVPVVSEASTGPSGDGVLARPSPEVYDRGTT